MKARAPWLLRTKPLQVGFLVLLAICSAQLAWWLYDQVEYGAQVHAERVAAAEADAAAATRMLRAGTPWDTVQSMYPDLVPAGDTCHAVVAPAVLARLRADRFHRVNRFAWEGAFFLVVLLAAMAVVYQSLRAAAALNRRQELFLASASHELKSPLASIRLSIETLALRDPPAERRAELVERVLTDIQRLDRTIANLLTTSRVGAGTARSAPERIDLAREVRAVVDDAQSLAAESGVAVSARVPGELAIYADPEGARTVLRNLVDNAIKATRGGGSVTVHGSAANGHVIVDVEDTGVGFPPEEGPRLFDKFYRVDGDTRPGTGLGLFLVRRCVELDGGMAQASSAGPGKGARFTVAWPAAKEEQI